MPTRFARIEPIGKPAIWFLVLAFTACSSSSTPTTTIASTSTTTMSDGSWFIYEGPPTTTMAELIGVISIDVETHCVRVGDTQAVFPEGTSLDLSDPERPGLVLPSGRTVYSGDMAEFFGGGNLSPITGPTANCGIYDNFAVGG